jgi:xanthine dehydrogenase molybdopterin-binding subunit B
MFIYFAFGCSTTEVELDVLTGIFDVIRTDVLMDVRDSLNIGTQFTYVTGTQGQILTLYTHIGHRYRTGGGRVAGRLPRHFLVLGDTKNPKTVHLSNRSSSPVRFTLLLRTRCERDVKKEGRKTKTSGSTLHYWHTK